MWCLRCRHDLRQASDHRCPKCGRAFDPKDDRTFWQWANQWFLAPWTATIAVLLAMHFLVACFVWLATGVFFWIHADRLAQANMNPVEMLLPSLIGVGLFTLSLAAILAARQRRSTAQALVLTALVLALGAFLYETADDARSQVSAGVFTEKGYCRHYYWINWCLYHKSDANERWGDSKR